MEFNKIGILGAGNIGIGVATDLILHGLETVLVDISDKQLENAKTEIVKNVRFAPLFLKDSPKISKHEIEQKLISDK